MKLKEYITEASMSNPIMDKLKKKQKITKQEYLTYKGFMDQIASVNKQFNMVASNTQLSNILSKDMVKTLQDANRIMQFKGWVPLSIAKDLVEE